MPLARTDSVYSFGSATTDVHHDDHESYDMFESSMPTTEIYAMEGQLLELPKAGQGTAAAGHLADPKFFTAPECESVAGVPACDALLIPDVEEKRNGDSPTTITVQAPAGDASAGAIPTTRVVSYEPRDRSTIVGTGGFGTVYIAHDARNFRYALKVIPRATNAAVNEAKILATVKHVNLLRFYGASWLPNDSFAILTELAVGTVKDVMRRDGRDRASVSGALRVVDGVACALSALHAAGYVHRDVKPDNILVREDDSVVLADVGCACAHGFTGRVVGSPPYMPPEAFTSDTPTATAAWDVWALGCVLIELLSGEAPWAHLGLDFTCCLALANHLRCANGRNAYPFSDEALQSLPHELRRLATMCLSTAPLDRPSADAILDTMRRLVSWKDP